jgi:hypothetical protein
MKPGLHLLPFVMAGSLAAQEPAELPKPAKTSARLKQEIQGSLPKYTPPPPQLLGPPDLPAIEQDPNVLALPTVTVRETRPRNHDPDLWLTDRAIQQKALAAYKQSMTELEWALNSWFIPLVSPPAAARARSAYATNKAMAELQRVHRLLNLISAVDAKGATELEKERVKMDQTEYWQSRPAGHGRTK